MLFFLIFLPYFTLATLSWVIPIAASLLLGAVAAAGLLLRDAWLGRSAKLINIATAVMFTGLGLLLLTHPAVSAITVRTTIDAGLLLVVLVATAIGFPFTLQYAREEAEPPGAHLLPEFICTNYVLSWTWIGALALMLVADIIALWLPSAPVWTTVAVAFAARTVAVQFTKWYTRRARQRATALLASPVTN
jgi:hypothetical protein